MENGRDAHDIVVEEKEDAVVADAQTEYSGQDSMERRDVAAAGAGMVQNDLEDSEGGGSVNLADISAGGSCQSRGRAVALLFGRRIRHGSRRRPVSGAEVGR